MFLLSMVEGTTSREQATINKPICGAAASAITRQAFDNRFLDYGTNGQYQKQVVRQEAQAFLTLIQLDQKLSTHVCLAKIHLS